MEARTRLSLAQEELVRDRMNINLIENVKSATQELLHWNETDERIMQQKAKVDWLRLGDGNNAFFHATLKAKNRNLGITTLQNVNGQIFTKQYDLEGEIMEFYT